MVFCFDKKNADEMMSRINLRDISSRAKQWDHPVKGLLKYSEELKKCEKDVLKLPKKVRELYCVSLLAVALQNDTHWDWWVNIPYSDPPDGLVMTLMPEKLEALKGYLRQVEVVEHRKEPNLLFESIRDKMVEYAYDRDTVLICLVLSPAVYDLKSLSKKLGIIPTLVRYIFVIFAGVAFVGSPLTEEQLKTSFTMVQLLPEFNETTFNLRYYLQDFKKKYDKGQESRLIEDDKVYYGTANPKFHRENSINNHPK